MEPRRKFMQAPVDELPPGLPEIACLGLGGWAYNALVRNKVTTLRKLCRLSLSDLSAMENLGKASVLEIVLAMEQYGLSLKKTSWDERYDDWLIALADHVSIQKAAKTIGQPLLLVRVHADRLGLTFRPGKLLKRRDLRLSRPPMPPIPVEEAQSREREAVSQAALNGAQSREREVISQAALEESARLARIAQIEKTPGLSLPEKMSKMILAGATPDELSGRFSMKLKAVERIARQVLANDAAERKR